MGGGSSGVKETEAEKAAASVAKEQWDLYQGELKPYEDTFINRVGNFNTESNMKNSKQNVDLSYAKNYQQARGGLSDNLAAGGIDPTSGKYGQSMASLATDQGNKSGDTVNRAQVGEQDKYLAGLQDISAIGQGQKAESLAGLGSVAQQSQNKAITDANDDFNRRSANSQLAGTVAGAGLSSYMNQTPDKSDESSDNVWI